MSFATKSPINRLGGKYFLRHWIAEKIPSHTLYCEPFVGAGHLLFTKTPSKVEIINDVDKYLMLFFEIIKDSLTRQQFTDCLDFMPYSRNLWQDIRTKWKLGNLPDNKIELIAQWFYLNRTCFSGDQKRGGFAVPSTTGRNPIISFRNSINGLDTIAERLRNVCIENLDYSDCIQKYDSENTLFYCDPPYLGVEFYYDNNCFTEQDHYTLADILHKAEARVILSHYANTVYDKLYRDWYKFESRSFKGSTKVGLDGEKPRTVEILYTNFDPMNKTRNGFIPNLN